MERLISKFRDFRHSLRRHGRKADKGSKGSFPSPVTVETTTDLASPPTQASTSGPATSPLATTTTTQPYPEQAALLVQESSPPSTSSVAGHSVRPTTTDADDSPVNDDDPWDLGYKKVQKRESDLMADYEKHLTSLPHTAVGSVELSNKESVEPILKWLLETREQKQWRIALLGKDIKVREQAEILAKFLIWSDSLVKSALSTQPYAALAWSGVSLLLPLITEGTAHVETILKGFNSINNVQIYWQACKATFLQHPEYRQHYQTVINPLVEVYSHVIEYQARAICHLSKAQLSRAWQSVNGYDWAQKASDVVARSESCANLLPIGQVKEVREYHEKELLEMKQSQAILTEIRQILGQTQKIFEDQNEGELLQALASDYNGYKDFNAQRVKGTCEWFFADKRFLNWRDSNSFSLLWVSAGPGCGKSVLSRALVDECLLSAKITTSAICHFFFKDGDDRRMHSRDALCAILHQLFTHDFTGSLISKALPSHKNYGEKLPQTFSELWKILLECATSPDSGEIICILDALDECEEKSRKILIGALKQFYSEHEETPKLKFLITSRPYDNIEVSFQSFSNVAEYLPFDGDDKSEEIGKEINLVIDEKVDEITPGFSSEDRLKIRDRLKAMDNRTYLWLYLTFDIIRGSPPEYGRPVDVENLLSSLPFQISEAYEKILDRSKNTKQTQFLLQIVLAAAEPLTLDEANVALASALQKKHFASPRALASQLWPRENFKSVVKNLCGLFISVYDSKLSFIHLTAREFLLNPKRQGEWEGRLSMQGSHSTMSLACLHYLLLPDLTAAVQNSPDRQGAFFTYAANNWNLHYRSQEDNVAENSLKDARELCHVKGRKARVWMTKVSGHFHELTDLCLATSLRLNIVVEDILKKGERDVNEVDGFDNTALYLATMKNYSDIVQILLDKGADVNASSEYDTALQVASRNDYREIVQMLLDKGADVNIGGGYFGPPLQAASRNDYREIVQMLLDKGADVNASSEYGTALQAASRYNRREIVQMLLDKGADVSLLDEEGHTALQVALRKRHRKIAQMLLDKGADINALDDHCYAVLQAASFQYSENFWVHSRGA